MMVWPSGKVADLGSGAANCTCKGGVIAQAGGNQVTVMRRSLHWQKQQNLLFDSQFDQYLEVDGRKCGDDAGECKGIV